MGIEVLVMKQQGQRHPHTSCCSGSASSSRTWGNKRKASARRRQQLGEPRKPCCRGGSRLMPAPRARVSWAQQTFLFFLCCYPPPASLYAAPKSSASRGFPRAELPGLPWGGCHLEGRLTPWRHGHGSSARASATFTHPALYAASWQQPSYTNL